MHLIRGFFLSLGLTLLCTSILFLLLAEATANPEVAYLVGGLLGGIGAASLVIAHMAKADH